MCRPSDNGRLPVRRSANASATRPTRTGCARHATEPMWRFDSRRVECMQSSPTIAVTVGEPAGVGPGDLPALDGSCSPGTVTRPDRRPGRSSVACREGVGATPDRHPARLARRCRCCRERLTFSIYRWRPRPVPVALIPPMRARSSPCSIARWPVASPGNSPQWSLHPYTRG
jgi:hypothetical protein